MQQASTRADLESRRARALGQADTSGVVDVNEEGKQAATRAGASREVLDALERQGAKNAPKDTAAQEREANAQRVLASLGQRDEGEEGATETPETAAGVDTSEGETESALSDIRSLSEPKQAAGKTPDIEADEGQWDRSLAEARSKRDATERAAASGVRQMPRATSAQSGVRTAPQRGKMAPDTVRDDATINVNTGDFKADEDEKVTRSRRIAKSEAFAQVLYLAPRVDRMLKSASAPRLVVQRRASNFHLISLGA
jgi:hypothetical protein